MDDQNRNALARIRLEKAEELLNDAKNLLEQESYMSANNRAFYSIEKSVKALLATKKLDAKTHNGCLKLFNVNFVTSDEKCFDREDYKRIERAERIRRTSDYDDFYIVEKREAIQQVEDAESIFLKTKNYISNISGT